MGGPERACTAHLGNPNLFGFAQVGGRCKFSVGGLRQAELYVRSMEQGSGDPSQYNPAPQAAKGPGRGRKRMSIGARVDRFAFWLGVKNQGTKQFALETYFYLEHLLWALCAIFPQPIRRIVFRLIFRRFGASAIIDYGVYVRYAWKVSIGNGSILNRGCRIYASYALRDAEIIIGDRVALGPDVVLCGAGHDYATLDLVDTAETISIHQYAWVGARSIILPGVEIGEGAVVGAGSVVTRNVRPWTVVAGNPAREIKQRTLRYPAGTSMHSTTAKTSGWSEPVSPVLEPSDPAASSILAPTPQGAAATSPAPGSAREPSSEA